MPVLPSLSAADRLVDHHARRLETAITADPALVVAPHQDDETLGCGGTILLKREMDAEVTIAFLADGTASHRTDVDSEWLGETRRREALRSARVLDVDRDRVRFLDLPDGRLNDVVHRATVLLRNLIHEFRPKEIYVPHRRDGRSDHLAANRALRDAISTCDRPISIFEYPIWFWRFWPLVPLPIEVSGRTPHMIGRTLRAVLEIAASKSRIVSHRIERVKASKRRALECHRSQMRELVPGVEWATLADVSDGHFLSRFFCDHELFFHYEWTGDDR